jgi:Na+-transporting NADH:ubiquinone oxidoreductase subunit C
MKDRIMMVVFVIVSGTILTGALVAVNAYTAPVIERNSAVRLKRNVLVALGIAAGQTDREIEEAFGAGVEENTAGGRAFFRSGNTGDIAFEYTGPGLWGPITGAIAVNDAFRTIKGLTVFHQEETPGLGSRITEPAYLAQFQGKSFRPALRLVAAGKASDDLSIDAITGATMTCNAFIKLLNQNLAAAAVAYGGGSP